MDNVPKSVNERFRGAAEHARHDRLLVARYGAGDAYPAELDEARQLVTRCAECARLAADIEVLRASTAALPVPRRPRDFRLTAEQADSLRGSAVSRWLRRLAAPGLAPIRPLAGAALSVGLLLVVAGVALPTPAGDLMALEQFGEPVTRQDKGPATTQLPSEAGGVNAPDQTSGPGVLPTGEAPQYVPPDDVPPAAQPAEDGDAPGVDIGLGQEYAAAESTRGLLITSGLLIGAISLGLLLLVVFARRRWTDRLLR